MAKNHKINATNPVLAYTCHSPFPNGKGNAFGWGKFAAALAAQQVASQSYWKSPLHQGPNDPHGNPGNHGNHGRFGDHRNHGRFGILGTHGYHAQHGPHNPPMHSGPQNPSTQPDPQQPSTQPDPQQPSTQPDTAPISTQPRPRPPQYGAFSGALYTVLLSKL